tara:strand:- start:769 stop:921 length:153 start_codon:yes stop_codon:yes gene_type:complete
MTVLNAFLNFVDRRPGVYFASCCGIGLIIRWFWCGQNVWRFIDPLAPIFR